MSRTVYEIGSLIEAVKGEEFIRGRVVQHAYAPGLYVRTRQYNHNVVDMELEGFTITVIEKAKPPVVLPTEPGIYVSWVNAPSPEIVHLTKSSGWVDANDENYMGVNELAKLMPLTRLAPVAETAKKILDRIADLSRDIHYSKLDKGTFRVVVTNLIAAEYGVTK